MKPITEKFRQRRRFLLVLPVLVLPFVSALFWALGGGRGTSAQAMNAESPGLNLKLPDAHFDGRETWDKFNLYEMARQDSARSLAARQNDPYYELLPQKTGEPTSTRDQNGLVSDFPSKSEPAPVDPNEARVHKKLDELYRELERGSNSRVKPSRTPEAEKAKAHEDPFSSDVDRLEKMMAFMHENPEPDPEMQQIESVLDKILQIQNPEYNANSTDSRTTQESQSSLAVSPESPGLVVSLLELHSPVLAPRVDTTFSASPYHINAFWEIEDETTFQENAANAIEAVIYETQRLVEGAIVSLRLLQGIQVAGYRLPPGQLLYGTCAIAGERLSISIKSLRAGSLILPVALVVYDLDGIEGIHVPGAITRDAAKQASGNALQNVQMMSLDPTLSAQAAAVGVEAAKGLFGRKAQLISVTVKAGHRILLRDKNDNHILP